MVVHSLCCNMQLEWWIEYSFLGYAIPKKTRTFAVNTSGFCIALVPLEVPGLEMDLVLTKGKFLFALVREQLCIITTKNMDSRLVNTTLNLYLLLWVFCKVS